MFSLRLETATTEMWNTERGWMIVDDTMRSRGGRGRETQSGLTARRLGSSCSVADGLV
jgi:hypothetical protein